MYRLGINIGDRNIEEYRKINYINTDMNVLKSRRLKVGETPRPDRFFTPLEDKREEEMKKIKKSLDKNLVIKIPERRL